MSEKPEVILNVLRVDQPLGQFFIGAIDARVLNKISYTEIRRFEEGSQEKLGGIQRERDPKRIKELAKYVNFDYSTFPTSVILALDERSVEVKQIGENLDLYELRISAYQGGEQSDCIPLEHAAFIIDGQHRLAGLQSLDPNRTFEINVSIFVGIDLADKAEIFRIVNLTQTKVNKSLSYDLFAYANKDSPHKTAHEIVLALNEDERGPFYQKIKRLGKATPGLGSKETLAQATVVEAIIRYITRNPEEERNLGFLGLTLPKRDQDEWKKFIFQYFSDRKDHESIFLIMTNYFSAVATKWERAWSDGERNYILNRTTGFNALMRFLREVYIRIGNKGEVLVEQDFLKLFAPMAIEDDEFTSDTFKPGSSGASQLFYRLMDEAGYGP